MTKTACGSTIAEESGMSTIESKSGTVGTDRHQRRKLLWIMAAAFLVIALLAVLARSAAAGDVAAGKALAEQWCQGCHLVTPGQREALDGAPPFAAIATTGPLNAADVETWLATPHPVMPDFALTRYEVDDLITYIESLRSE
jgi:mono/diheme cytochrome c family protein